MLNVGKRVGWAVLIGLLYWGVYWLCRHHFFALHRMMSWPGTLAWAGSIFIAISAAGAKYRLGLMTVFGYLVGFFFGVWFFSTRLDPGGGALTNQWSIWMGVFFAFVIFGVLWEVQRAKKDRRQKESQG